MTSSNEDITLKETISTTKLAIKALKLELFKSPFMNCYYFSTKICYDYTVTVKLDIHGRTMWSGSE